MNTGTEMTMHMEYVMSNALTNMNTFYCREDFQYKINEVMKQLRSGQSGYLFRLNELDIMSEAYGVESSRLCNLETQKEELKKIPTRQEMLKKLVVELHNIYLEFPVSVQFMERLVRRRLKGEFQEDSLRMAILKKFIKEIDSGTKMVAECEEWVISKYSLSEKEIYEKLDIRRKKEFILEHLDESIFNQLNGGASGGIGTDAEKNLQDKEDLRGSKKKKKKDWTLLRMVDNLALGKFKTNGVTKKQLYIFAIVFDMKLYLGMEGEEYDESRDLVKNLFFDYYNDNLLRYILDNEYKRNSRNYEAEPSGEGINYKNYAEIIYLYYIYRDDLAISPNEKLKRAESLMEKCRKKVKKVEERITVAPTDRTFIFKQNYIDILMKIDDEEELADYICANYYMYDLYNKAPILFASEQNTAKASCMEIMQAIQEEQGLDDNWEQWDAGEVDFGIDAEYLFADLREKFKDDKKFVTEVLDDKQFYCLMQKLDEKLHIKKRGFSVLSGVSEQKDKFTRTDLIALYYCYFSSVLNEMKENVDGAVDFFSIYSEFCEGNGYKKGINDYLEECRYQKISPKNIFDMFVVFALFLDQIQ